MALGRRESREGSMWIATTELPRSPGHPFYCRLNELLDRAGFDRFVEELCAPYYAEERGRPSIPPGVYFRMLFVGYFEGIDSQRGIAWRCSDSLSLREFLLLGPEQKVPDHSSLTVTRKRLVLEVFDEVFVFVLGMLAEAGLLRGRMVAVDSTSLEANAAMKTIVRKDTGEDWKAYVRRLVAEEEGIEAPTDEDGRRFDRKRKKRVSNQEWESSSDPDARIAKLKDGRTHLAYKAEHVVDLESDVVVEAEIYPADESDSETLVDSVIAADGKLARAGVETEIRDVVADKGYFRTQNLVECEREGLRTYIPEPKRRGRRRWKDALPGRQAATYRNRRRVRGRRSRALQRLRSEFAERSFAHSCETGGARRTWLRGLLEVRKRYRAHLAGRNLSRLMREVFGFGTPRGLQVAWKRVFRAVAAYALSIHERIGLVSSLVVIVSLVRSRFMPSIPTTFSTLSSTGC